MSRIADLKRPKAASLAATQAATLDDPGRQRVPAKLLIIFGTTLVPLMADQTCVTYVQSSSASDP